MKQVRRRECFCIHIKQIDSHEIEFKFGLHKHVLIF